MAGITSIPGGIAVQRGTSTVDFSVGGVSVHQSLDVTISAVDTSKTLVFAGIGAYNSTGGQPLWFSAELINATTLRLHVVADASNNLSFPVVWDVVEYA